MLIDKEKVMLFLPHREPFLFVDGVEKIIIQGRDLKEGDTITPKELVGSEVLAHYYTRGDHPIFAGHFPGNPILPGVVQIEMMAQASSFGLTVAFPNCFEMDMDVALLSVSEAKFRKPVLPEMDLVIKTKCTKLRGNFHSHDCEIYHNDELMSQATVMASVKLS